MPSHQSSGKRSAATARHHEVGEGMGGGMDGVDGVDGVDGMDVVDGMDGVDIVDGVDGVDGVDDKGAPRPLKPPVLVVSLQGGVPILVVSHEGGVPPP